MTTSATTLPAKPDDKLKTAPLAIASKGGGVQLTTIEEAYRFAKFVVASQLAPRDFTTPEKVIVAMQWGFEIGLTPMQALQSIAVIGQRPALWGDALPGLVQASGKCEYLREWFEGDGDGLTAFCESKRKDQSQPIRAHFSVSDAKKAKLWEKQGPWSQYPTRMLKMRARAYCLRDNFADVLRGIGVAEEVQDYTIVPTATPQTTIQTVEAVPTTYTDDLLDGALGKTAATEGDKKAEDASNLPGDIEDGGFTPEEIKAINERERQDRE
jgi:hypothetical protein